MTDLIANASYVMRRVLATSPWNVAIRTGIEVARALRHPNDGLPHVVLLSAWILPGRIQRDGLRYDHTLLK
jgi:hypothetical protein